jgi:ATP-dependent Clp protease ATP-binding subunit ClpX
VSNNIVHRSYLITDYPDLIESSSSLTSDFFSSLRPEQGERIIEAKSVPKKDRLMQSTSKIITTQALPRKAKSIPEPPQMDKSNMILIGPSGSGKTHLVRMLSTFLSVPFVHVDATPLTSAGYVGEDVESIMSRLLEAADWDVAAAERGIVCIDEVDKLASPAPSASSGTIKTAGRDVGGTGVQQALLRLLEGSVVNVADKRQSASPSASMSPRSVGARAHTLESKPWWSPEMNAEHGRAAQAMRAGGGGTETLSDGRRRASLTPGSDGTGTLKIDTSKVLFILCGAFVGLQDILAARGSTRLEEVEAEDLTSYGLIPEFVGRLPVIVTLNDLTEKDLGRILTEPKNALVSQYQSLFAASGIELRFTTPAIASLAHQAAQSSKTSSGARVLRRLMEKRLLDAMFDAPNGGASFALMDESAAQGRTQVHLFSRGGKAAYLNAIEEDEEKYKKSKSGNAKTTASHKIEKPFSAIKVNPSQVNIRQPIRHGSFSSTSILSRIDEANLRRRARARLTRPSRVGNLRILTSDG